MSLGFDTFNGATKKEQKLFWYFIFGVRKAESTNGFLRIEDGKRQLLGTRVLERYDTEILDAFLDGIRIIDYYRLLIDENDSLMNRDQHQCFFLENSDPKNHMPPFCVLADKSKRLPAEITPDEEMIQGTYGFHELQYWALKNSFFIQYLQMHYTIVCMHIFGFLQYFLEHRAIDYDSGLTKTEVKKLRKRIQFGVGKENLFLLFQVVKNLKKQVFAYEQKNRDSLVVKLKKSPFSLFFWNCNLNLSFDFYVAKWGFRGIGWGFDSYSFYDRDFYRQYDNNSYDEDDID